MMDPESVKDGPMKSRESGASSKGVERFAAK